MITATQILAHLWGDYILQSDWMAENKTKAWFPCACHVLLYSLGFLLFRPSWKAMLVIAGTHYFIDRYRLARYLVWLKNWAGGQSQFYGFFNRGKWISQPNEGQVPYYAANLPFRACAATGYPPDRPVWLTVWLLIIADNILHITINGIALKWL
jgi:hypothetical protein